MKTIRRALLLILSIALILTGCSSTPSSSGTSSVKSDAAYTFYFVRHGQTLFNVKELAQGWCDSPLTDDGVSQAKALGKGLASVKFDGAYTSISERAYDTANYVLDGTGITPVINEDLKEMNFGSMEGGPGADLDDVTYRLQYGWEDKGGESWDTLAARMKNSITKAVSDNPKGGTYLMSTHGMSILALVRSEFSDTDLYKNFMETYKGAIPNCAVTIIKYQNGTMTLVSLADTSYLGSESSGSSGADSSSAASGS